MKRKIMALRQSEDVTAPFVTAIIPCRNEEKHIGPCLESIIGNDYPKGRLEVLVVDGLSDDSSRQIAQRYAAEYAFIRILDNPKRILAAAWNVGIRNGRGDVMISMNAHATIEPEFVSKCVRYLKEYDADCVGPVLATQPQEDTIFGKAIAVVMSHPFGVGRSRFRIGLSRPEWVDTVHCGACRREVFDRVGLYNEELVRSQDIELHIRMKSAGAKILLAPDITMSYYTRSNPMTFVQYGFLNGYWVTYPFRFGAVVARFRHLVPLVFVSGLAVLALLSVPVPELRFVLLPILALYAVVAIAASLKAAFDQRNVWLAGLLPLIFATYHVTYGIGSTAGLLRALVSRRFWRSLRAMSALGLAR